MDLCSFNPKKSLNFKINSIRSLKNISRINNYIKKTFTCLEVTFNYFKQSLSFMFSWLMEIFI